MKKRFNIVQRMIMGFGVLLLSGMAVNVAAQDGDQKQLIKAIYIPLADHYAGIVAFEKYGPEMKHADYRIEMLPGPELVRARFREDDADMAFDVCPMVLDMFAENPNFRWVSLIHRDGNALAINDLLNAHVHLPSSKLDRKPDSKVADAYAKVKEELGKPSECAIPSYLATHTVVLYKYLKDHGKTLALGQGPDKDVIASIVPPPKSPAYIRKQNSRSMPASFEQSLPWPALAETLGDGHVAWYSKDVMNWPKGHVECVIIAKNAAIKEKREAVNEVIYYIHKAGRDIETARRAGGKEMDDIVAMIRKHIPAHSEKAIIQSLDPDVNAINYYNLNVDKNAKDSLKQIMDLAVEGGILKQTVNIDALADSSFSTEITEQEVSHVSYAPAATPVTKVPTHEAPGRTVMEEAPGAQDTDSTSGSWFLPVAAAAGVAILVIALLVFRGSLTSMLRAGLARTLLLWFLALSLVPLVIVSIVSYSNARTSLREDANRSLAAVAQTQTEHIDFLFSSMFADLQYQAEETDNVEFLAELRAAFVASKKPLREFQKSLGWQMLIAKEGSDLTTFRKTHGYYDVFLIDRDGNVLFSVAGEDDLGSNLFKGEYSGTLFAAACRKALETGRPVFSDNERYAPSGNDPAGFLVSVLVDEKGERIGVIALQVPIDRVDGIMKQRIGLGESGETYLVGEDYRIRIGSRFGEGDLLTTEVKTVASESALAGNTDTKIIKDYRGTSVLSHFTPLNIGDIRWAMIAEIDESEAFAPAVRLQYLVFGLLAGTLIVVLLIAIPLASRIVRPILTLSSGAERVAGGDLNVTADVKSRNEIGALGTAFNRMTAALKENRNLTQQQDWLKSGIAGLSEVMRGEKEVSALSRDIVTWLAEYLNARIGAIFLVDENHHLEIAGRYAYEKCEGVPDRFAFSEGLVGQAAADGKLALVTNVPDDYITVTSGLGQTPPRNIVILPFLFQTRVTGVIELGTLDEFSDLQVELLNQVTESIGIAVNAAQSRTRQQQLLEETQSQAEELQSQQEELKSANEELEEQTQTLQRSEERLKAQQEELEVTNEELEEKTDLLERQKKEVEFARKQIEEKAEEVALASKYKSEFLANMSHELRTPLNSLLLLAQGLSRNKEGNLSEEQVESARIIHGSGNDLLNLINEILDLSKIEAGRMDLDVGAVRVSDLAASVRSSFGHLAEEKRLDLKVVVSKGAPAEITSDRQRVEQVIRNLVSNAVKFTEQGSVTVTFGIADCRLPIADLDSDNRKLQIANRKRLRISVADTGIGISTEQQKRIFEAFQQADGGTSRKYGGTGLGLSISRELVRLLGGELQVESTPGEGSTFTLYLPIERGERGARNAERGREKERTVPSSELRIPTSIADDREKLEKNDQVILVIEDDPNFARILHEECHEKGFKCLAAPTGEAGLELAAKHLPGAVILDIRLPGMDGWSVLRALKDDTRTRHIPVHVVSVEEASTEAIRRGAVGHAVKPLDQEGLEETFRKLEQASAGKPRRVLVVEDDPKLRAQTVNLIASGDVKVDEAATGEEALEALRSGGYDCVVLDLKLPDMEGGEILATLAREGVELPPIIVHTTRDLTRDEEAGLREHAESIVIKDVRSQERLLDEVSLFLHRVVKDMPAPKQKIIRDLHDADEVLRDKKVLIVDDDMRTTFAVSRLLADRGMKPLKAENGERALRLLAEHPDVALVLMDIMMPVMDGYETMRRIRNAERGTRNVPIIALTAKAMPEDRQKCLDAGANDYMPKPVDEGRLVSMMRVWLCR